MNPLTKSSWYAVELFGKVFGSAKAEAQAAEDYSGPPQSLQETLNRIKLDNDRSYFLSGQVDEDIYDPDCVFSDPFVSFAGRDRFVTNLANLGSFITNYSARVLDYDADDSTVVQTKVSPTIFYIKKMVHRLVSFESYLNTLVSCIHSFMTIRTLRTLHASSDNGQVGTELALETNLGVAMGRSIYNRPSNVFDCRS
jgi:hypothetical protein